MTVQQGGEKLRPGLAQSMKSKSRKISSAEAEFSLDGYIGAGSYIAHIQRTRMSHVEKRTCGGE